MATNTSLKISSATASAGSDGQINLASGKRSSMRMWRDEQPGEAKPATTRPYETIGYVLGGRAELHLGDDVVVLEAGDSWTVPEGVSHTYKILETFSAIESTTPAHS